MLHAAPGALEDAWSVWLGALGQPVVLACAADWGVPEHALLTLTLLDERGAMRVQASTDAVDGVPAAVLSTLRSAGMNVRADERVRLSRHEGVLSSLMAAFALPFAESCKPHEKAPLPSPSARGEALHPLQAAFAKEDALQCGSCAPGQLMSAAGLPREKRAGALGIVAEARASLGSTTLDSLRRRRAAPHAALALRLHGDSP